MEEKKSFFCFSSLPAIRRADPPWLRLFSCIYTLDLEASRIQLSASVADLQKGQSQINSTVVGIDATVIEIDEKVFKMEQNGKIIVN